MSLINHLLNKVFERVHWLEQFTMHHYRQCVYWLLSK